MADLLVPLYGLGKVVQLSAYSVRRPLAFESGIIRSWIADRFSSAWADEVLPALARTPATLFMAVDEASGRPIGFCAWDCTALGFLGPVGVAQEHRKRGVGKALVLSVLHSMREQGYGYCIVGAAGPEGFFNSVSEVFKIAGSTPGIYSASIK